MQTVQRFRGGRRSALLLSPAAFGFLSLHDGALGQGTWGAPTRDKSGKCDAF